MHMIGHQMALHYLRLLMLRQFLENLPKVRSQRPEHLLCASLRDKDNVVLTVPSCMAQTLILFHRGSPASFGEDSENHCDRRIGQTSVSPPAEPGAYLTELTIAAAESAIIMVMTTRFEGDP